MKSRTLAVWHLAAIAVHLLAARAAAVDRGMVMQVYDLKETQIDYWYDKAREEMHKRFAERRAHRWVHLAIVVIAGIVGTIVGIVLS